MIKSSLDFLGLWWELGHPTLPNQHFRLSDHRSSWIGVFESWSFLSYQILVYFFINKNPPYSTVIRSCFFCFKELCGQHDSFSHPPAEENPPGSEQRLRESLWALHRALAMPGTMGDPPLMPFDEGKWWRHMMLQSALDWDEYGMIGMFFSLHSCNEIPIWRNVDFS